MTADDTTTTDPSDPVERLRRLGDQLALAPPVPAPSVEDLAGRAVGEAAVETPAPPPALEAPHQVRGPGRLPSGPPARSRRRRVGPSLALAAALVVVLGLVGATLFGSTASSKFSTVGSAVSDGTPGDASTGGGPALPQLPVLPPGNDPDPAGPTGPAARRQIRDATVVLETEPDADLDAVADAAVAVAVEAGGAVAGDDRRFGPDPTATLVLRVPPDQVEAVVDRLRDLATPTTSSIDTDDVTEQYTDLESRIATLERSVDRVQRLIDDADDVVQIAALENELRAREVELESLKGQLRVLTDETALATVTVTIAPRPEAPRPPPAVDDEAAAPLSPPGPGDALGNGWSAFATSVSWLTAVALTVLPFAVTALVVLGGLRVRRRRRPAAA